MRRNLNIAFGIVILLLFLGGLYYYAAYLPQKRPQEFKRFTQDYEEARKTFHYGNYDDVITAFIDMLPTIPGKSAEAQVKLKLAAALFSRNNGADRQEAIRILKSIAADIEMPPFYKAFAMASLAHFFELTVNLEPMRELVFNDEPYAALLKEANGSIGVAVRKIYERSDGIQPNALAKLEIAMMYADRLMAHQIDAGMTREKTAEFIQQYVRDGTPLIEEVVYEPTRGQRLYVYEPSQRSFLFMIRAIALGVSERILKNIKYQEVEQSFQKSISLSQSYPNDLFVQEQAMTARLYYAASLWSRFNRARLDDIRELLRPISESRLDPQKEKLHVEFLKNTGEREGTFLHTNLVAIANVLPEFRSYLIQQAGWIFLQ